MKSGDIAWIATGITIATYELAAALHPSGELLSEACDRYRTRRPILTHAAIIYLAGHLTRLWPRHLDPLCIASDYAAKATR